MEDALAPTAQTSPDTPATPSAEPNTATAATGPASDAPAAGETPATSDSSPSDQAAPTPPDGMAAAMAPDSAAGDVPGAEALSALAEGAEGSETLLANPYGIEALWVQGDLVIKSVAVLLLLMSVASWYVIVSRGVRTMRLRRAARRAQRFWHAQNVDEGLEAMGGDAAHNPFRRLVEDGLHARDHHVARKQELHGQLSLADWLTGCLRTAIDEAAERMQSGLSVLASVGSTAPFVGLFGTVWGIYHALVAIGVSGQASIDKVAGPVGEALIMTAFGLAVAIPAVLGYNMLVRSNKGVLGQLNRFAHHLHAFLVTGAPVATPRLKVAHIQREAS